MFRRLASIPDIKENTSDSGQQSWSWVPWVGLLAGIAVLGQLYYQASQTNTPNLFGRFWLGMFLFYFPLFWRQLSSNVSRYERISLLVAAGLFSYLPKLLRCPSFFCYSDELTWWRGVQVLLRDGPILFQNPLGEVQGLFPGLPLMTVVLQKASGLSTYQVGLILIGLVHLISLISIFLIGEKIFHSSKVGAIASLIYVSNPDFLFFNSQFSYESLSVPLIILILLYVQYILNNPEGQSKKAWTFLIAVTIITVVMTHHISSYMLAAILTLMSLSALFLPRYSGLLSSSRRLYYITLLAYAACIGWFVFVASDVYRYIKEPILMGIEQFTSFTVRRLFGGITLPLYEISSGYLAAILIGVLALMGAFVIFIHKKVRYAAEIGLLAFGLLYFVTAPLVLTPWGSEAGRRSWTYSFISLSILSGVAITWLVERNSIWKLKTRFLGPVLSVFLLTLLLVGGVASSTTISYRFPGEYLQNSDARSFTVEIIDSAQWMLSQGGANNRVLGDRTTERIFGSYGLQQPAMLGGPRPWEVFLPTSWTADALYWLEQAKAPFIVVDQRMAELPPQMDIRFQRGEPPIEYSNQPLPKESIRKFDDLTQLNRIFDSGNIRIYSLNTINQTAIEPSNRTKLLSQQNLPNTNEDAHNPDTIGQLINMLRSFILVILLIIPGFIIGRVLFRNWPNLDIVLRLLVALGLSINIILLPSFVLALILPSVEIVTNVTIMILGGILAFGLIQLIEYFYYTRRNIQKPQIDVQQVFDQAWNAQPLWAFLVGIIGILFVVLLMGAIKPENNPRTVFALELSSATPKVQIINHEGDEKTYWIKIYSAGSEVWTSQPFDIENDQSTELDIPKRFHLMPASKIVYVDLFIEGQSTQYRSLHFSPNTLKTGSRSSLIQIPGD